MQQEIHVPKFKLGKRKFDVFPIWIALLFVGLAIGAMGAYQVLTHGLVVTGLSNQVPWGLWIAVDISSIALGGGAFVLGVIVYILKIKRYENIGKLAVLIGFLGYSTAGLVLLFDLGQPLRFWHPVVFWQVHSLLWEITMCVVLYLTVLGLELFPTVTEHAFFQRFPFISKIAHSIHRFGPVLAVVGLTLSLLHQASLGATYGVLAGRGMLFSATVPVLFVFSAVGGGLSLLFLLSALVFRTMRPGLVSDKVLRELARMAGGMMLLYLYLLLWDWAVNFYYSFDGQSSLQLELLNSVAPYLWSFWIGQVLFGALIPGAVLLSYRKGGNLRLRLVASVFAVVSVVIMRWNYNFAGSMAYIHYAPFVEQVKLAAYSPTWQEYAVATGVISYWLLGFSLAARYLPFKSPEHH